MTVLSRRHFVLAAAAMLTGAPGAIAAEYPERPITVIIPYAAGGAGDTILRLLSPLIEKNLGQPLIVDNRAGGGGTIGAQAVAKAAPDGYTLMLGATNNFVINQFLFPKVSFDPLASFALITKVADVPSVLYASLSAPPTLRDFIAHAKANPGKLSYASPSVGTTPHLSVERLKQLTGIDLVHIPYRGAPPAMQALMANEVHLYLAGWGVGKGQVESGRVRALAVASRERIPNIPLADRDRKRRAGLRHVELVGPCRAARHAAAGARQDLQGLGHGPRRYAVAVVLGEVAVLLRVAGTGQADGGADEPIRLVRILARHHAVDDLARANELEPLFAADLLAMRGEDRGDGDQVGCLRIGIAERKLERRKPILVHADTVRKPDGFGDQKVVDGGEATLTNGDRRLFLLVHGKSKGSSACNTQRCPSSTSPIVTSG